MIRANVIEPDRNAVIDLTESDDDDDVIAIAADVVPIAAIVQVSYAVSS